MSAGGRSSGPKLKSQKPVPWGKAVMSTFRLATFNVENLFAHHRIRKSEDVYVDEGFTENQLAFDIYSDFEKAITAKAIRAVDADTWCLREVESLPLLDRFNSTYPAAQRYKHRIVVDGSDPRYIDVAVLSRYPIVEIRSHRHERTAAGNAALFSRDFLKVVVDIEGKRLTPNVNHPKSMIGGRKETHPRRKEQADRVAAVVDGDWQTGNYEGTFVVLGDMNDYMEAETSLGSLVNHPGWSTFSIAHLRKRDGRTTTAERASIGNETLCSSERVWTLGPARRRVRSSARACRSVRRDTRGRGLTEWARTSQRRRTTARSVCGLGGDRSEVAAPPSWPIQRCSCSPRTRAL